MSLKVWRFACIYLVAITLALTLSHPLEIPRKLQYGQALYASVQHTMHLYFASVGARAEIAAVVCLTVLCFLAPSRRNIFRLALGATICVTAGLVVWLAVVAPANAQMAQWATAPLPNNWESTRRHWEFGHSASAILHLIGFGALITSVLLSLIAERGAWSRVGHMD
jgi:hypothetical protein